MPIFVAVNPSRAYRVLEEGVTGSIFATAERDRT